MNLCYEVDYGMGPFVYIEEMINASITKLFERNKLELWFDRFWTNEYGEVLHGSLLVTAQAYCVGSLRDISTIKTKYGVGSMGSDSID
jgi:hypothetical protein